MEKEKKKKKPVRLDVRLLALIAEEEWENREEKVKEDIDKFLSEHGCDPISPDWRGKFLKFRVSQLEKWLDELQRICERSWAEQGRSGKTLQFVRDKWEKVIGPKIRAGLDFVNDLLKVGGLREMKPSFLVRATEEEWAPHGARLKKQWRRKLKIEETKLRIRGRESSGRVWKGNPERARGIGKLLKELHDLKGQIFSESDYEAVRRVYPTYFTFQILDEHPRFKPNIINLAVVDDLRDLAITMAAKYYRIEKTTAKSDWDKAKPQEDRRKPK
jgi:hypothetical protein